MATEGGRPAAPVEDRSYLFFGAAGLALAIGAGLVLGLLSALGPALGWMLPAASLVQAHAASELDGWLGLFVAGFGLRLVPRLGHRPPPPKLVSMAVLGLLAAGVGLRVVGLLLEPALAPIALAAAVLQGSGQLLFALAIASSLWGGRGSSRGEPWRVLIWLALGWWAVWAVLTMIGASPAGVSMWVVLLGAVGNMIWAIQSRSVPIFYGRRAPTRRALAAPTALLNLGAAAALASLAPPVAALSQVGLGLAGLGLLWMAPLAGSVRGRALRLREPSRPAAAFVVMADRWALVAGCCLIAGALLTWWHGPGPAARFDEAAVHALGLGLATTLVVGMARLLAPVFAIARAVPGAGRRSLPATWLALALATACRVAAALLEGAIPTGLFVTLISLAGLFTLAGLGHFAAGFAAAWARQAGRRRRLRSAAVASDAMASL